jgi:hypothetical protein
VSTAWLGPFLGAWLKAAGRDAEAQTRARGWFDAVMRVSDVSGHVPDLLRVAADGSSAALAGDPASPLAAAELLRAWIEELDRPAVRAAGAATG